MVAAPSLSQRIGCGGTAASSDVSAELELKLAARSGGTQIAFLVKL
jgi:hypothetical protein